jgi:hypothetical protein
MKKLILFILLMKCVNVNSQYIYKTYYGDYMSPVDTFRVLNIFVNIIFDQTPNRDTLKDVVTPNWLPGPANTMNVNPPVYLADYMDSDFNPDFHGTYTKRYAQASFNKFIVLGDHVVVNIAQSRITPTNPGAYFNFITLMNSSISLINDLGGLHTINGHDSITDYDGTLVSSSYSFKQKTPSYNGRIDFIQFFFRNSSRYFGTYDGGGTTGYRTDSLLIGGTKCINDGSSIQGRMGNKNLSNPEINPTEVHEMAHDLLGMNNSAHMGGGGPVNYGDLVTLEFNAGGWSLIGSAGSSLISCNGFERWRLNWIGPTNNNIPIAVNHDSSDIEKSDGPKTFYLRDFISYGDAIRIKLPYIDAGALNQYIWLENHRLKPNNGKEDYPAYWETACKDDGIPGIYSYYQVGKDIREGSFGDMLPSLTDHLVPICADGNWDVNLLAGTDIACVNGQSQYIQEYVQENPFSGYNDLKNHYFNSTSGDTLNWKHHRMEMLIKKKNGVITNKLANMGDNDDAFTGTKSITLSTNPASVNVVTYYHTRPDTAGTIYESSRIDNRIIHLSGLHIDMVSQQNGTIRVDVRWNDYDVTKNVRWTGNIVLHENINLAYGKTITFDQNYTPNMHIRNAVTGVFADPTYFTCLGNSSFVMQSTSKVILQNLSSFILESGSRLEINDGAIFTVKSGCTFQVKSGANLVVKGSGRVEVENGGYLCIQSGSNDTLLNNLSVINLRPGYHLGVNTAVLSDPGTCRSQPGQITFTGTGAVNTFNTDVYVQNKIFAADKYYAGNIIYVGYDVTTPPYGDVIVQSGVKVIFDAQNDVFLKNNIIINSGGIVEFVEK